MNLIVFRQKFHDFIINLKHLRFIYTKCPHYYELGFQRINLFVKKTTNFLFDIDLIYGTDLHK